MWNSSFQRLASFAIILFGLNSCVDRNINIDNAECIAFNPLEITKEITDIENYIETIEILPLKTADKIFNLSTRKMLVLDNGDFVMLTNSDILKFNPNGDYMLTFGKRGRGAGEYIKVYDICLNNDLNQLWALNS